MTKLYQGKDPLRWYIKKNMAIFMPGVFDQRPMCAIQALLTPKFGQGEMDLFFGAQTVIYVLVSRLGISHPLLDAGICCQNMVLTAHALGLGTCFSGFAAEPINRVADLRRILGIEWPYDQVAAAIVLGYPAADLAKPVEREFPKVTWME